jgi:hypothetical protein
VIIAFAGRDWQLDVTHVTFRQALAIQAQTGLSIADWEDSLDFKRNAAGEIANPPPGWLTSVGALYWLMLAQNGQETPPEAMDFDFTGFLQAYFEALAAEIERIKAAQAKAEAEPDPTRPSPTASPASPTSGTPMTTTPPTLIPQEGAAIVS